MGNLVTSHNSSAHGVLIFDQVQANGYPRLLIIMGLRSWPAGVSYQAQSDVIWHFRDSQTLSMSLDLEPYMHIYQNGMTNYYA